MSYSNYINVVSGFLVDESDLFDYKTFDIHSCTHIKEHPEFIDKIDYCPSCGRKISIRQGQHKTLKKKFNGILDYNIDAEHNGMWYHTMRNGNKIVLRHLVNSWDNSSVWFVGKEIFRMEGGVEVADKGIFCRIDHNELLSEISLATILESEGIPYDRNSFGLYLLEDSW